MNIREIHENKKQFLSLLLLADEQENMVDRYLENGAMYVLNDCGVKAEYLKSRILQLIRSIMGWDMAKH